MFTGLLEHGELYHKFDEDIHEGMRLGRNMWLDARSLAHMVENSVEAMSGPIRSVEWERVLAVLDQGQVGSCTGNAGTGALGTRPFYDRIDPSKLPSMTDAADAENFAVDLYEDATKVDAYPGTYPDQDTGSSGLAICKVLKTRGIITGYRWARSPYGFLRLLQDGPVLQGMPWYKAFFDPDGKGFIDASPTWEGSGVAGGHEVEAIGVEIDENDVFDSVITYVNSWGTSWGDGGRFRMRLRTYEKLSGIDLKQYVV